MSEEITIGKFLMARRVDGGSGFYIFSAHCTSEELRDFLGELVWSTAYKSYTFIPQSHAIFALNEHLRPLVEFMKKQGRVRDESESWPSASARLVALEERVAAIDRFTSNSEHRVGRRIQMFYQFLRQAMPQRSDEIGDSVNKIERAWLTSGLAGEDFGNEA